MIFVTAEVDKNKILQKVVISGHSGFAKKGKDIVCSAVSILLQSLYLSLNNIGDVKIYYADDKEKVLLEIKEYVNDVEGELRGITLQFILGIKSLSKEYNKYISFMLKEN